MWDCSIIKVTLHLSAQVTNLSTTAVRSPSSVIGPPGPKLSNGKVQVLFLLPTNRRRGNIFCMSGLLLVTVTGSSDWD